MEHRHTKLKKGQMVPQTIEDLQYVMSQDAILMEKLDRENRWLKDRLIRKQAAVVKWKAKYYQTKRELECEKNIQCGSEAGQVP